MTSGELNNPQKQ